jgi:uncharacterized damage-inducible protein DinB
MALCASLSQAKGGGFTSDMLSQVDEVEKKILQLEEAVPQDKYSWRPAEGVRSVSEVYLHIASGNYLMMKIAGFAPPAESKWGSESDAWDKQTTDKAKILGELKKSFAHVRASLAKVSEKDLEQEVDFFGQKMTKRSELMAALSHLHEHLGQSIAYARMNGVVPPWSLPQPEKK